MEFTRSRIDSRRSEWPLLLGLALYALSFFVFYPETFAIIDEDAYLTQAYLLRSGRVSYDNSSVGTPHFTVNVAGRTVSKYPPGNALFLIPFTWLGWRAVFVSGLLLALVGTLLVRAMIRKLAPDTDTIWSLLYLLYPSVVLFSRTVMSDLLATTAVLTSAWFTLKHGRWSLAAGFALGLACLVRYSNAVLAPAFLAILLSRNRARFRSALLWFAGLVPGTLAILLYNSYAFGDPFGFPMFLTGHFSVSYFWRNLWFYGVSLLAFYPLMLLAPLAAGRRRLFVLGLPAGVVLVFYCFFSYIHDASSFADRVAVGTRYLLPAIPFFVIGYAIVVGRLESRVRRGSTLKYLLLAALFVLGVAIQYRHHRVLSIQDRYRRMLYEAVPESALLVCSPEASELISYAWGWRDYVEYIRFGAPVPLAKRIADSDTAYAVTLAHPGRNYQLDRAVFETLLARNGSPAPVVETEEPLRFRVCRLKPLQ